MTTCGSRRLTTLKTYRHHWVSYWYILYIGSPGLVSLAKILLRLCVVADPDLLWGQILEMLIAYMPEEFYMWMFNLKQILEPLLERAIDLLQVVQWTISPFEFWLSLRSEVALNWFTKVWFNVWWTRSWKKGVWKVRNQRGMRVYYFLHVLLLSCSFWKLIDHNSLDSSGYTSCALWPLADSVLWTAAGLCSSWKMYVLV